MRRICLVIGFAAFALPAQAEDAALQLASVLAAEKVCGLTFHQPAIAAWIDKHVEADDLSFAGELRLYMTGREYELRTIGVSEKTALCAQTMRVAKAYGFVK